jgi:hypothetical protein
VWRGACEPATGSPVLQRQLRLNRLFSSSRDTKIAVIVAFSVWVQRPLIYSYGYDWGESFISPVGSS